MKVIYLKLTDKCQLKCKHCYISSDFDSCLNMTDDTIEQTIKFLDDYAKLCDCETLIIFHGGEPTIAGLDKINYIIDKLKHNTNIFFNITTNLVYNITQQHIELFSKFYSNNKKAISTSWDYMIRFSDKQQELWENNVRYLLDHDIDVNPIICVTKQLINKYSNTDELFEYFTRLGVKTINFERITLNGRALIYDVKPNNHDIDEWMLKAYISSKKYGICVTLFSILENAVQNNIYIGCRKRECTSCVRTINTNGTISGCPNTYDVIFGDILGNINNEVVLKEQNKEFFKSNECYLCKYYKICNGECYQLVNDSTGCPGLKLLIQHILDCNEIHSS